MARDPRVLVYVGVKNSVVALDEQTGTEMWRTHLRGSDFVSILWDGQMLLAANSGEVWRLDPENGAVLWHNSLKGFGRGVISLASSRRPGTTTVTDPAAAKRRRDAEHSAVAAAT
jgi:outer membrane protein assembly factor BamB